MSADGCDDDDDDAWLKFLMTRPLAPWEVPARIEWPSYRIPVHTDAPPMATQIATAKKSGAPSPPAHIATANKSEAPSPPAQNATAKESGAPSPPAQQRHASGHQQQNNNDPVQWRLQPTHITNAGKILAHCAEGVEYVLGLYQNLVIFKIGASVDPVRRWFHPDYGYHRDSDFEHFRVLGRTRTSEGMCFLESALIALFKDRPGCRNIALGGDGISLHCEASAFFVYVVYRVLPRPPPKHIII